MLDTHDDLIAELTVRVKQVIGTLSPVASGSLHRIASQLAVNGFSLSTTELVLTVPVQPTP